MPEYAYIDLERALHVEKVAEDTYQSTQKLYVPLGAKGVFGGTLVAQALYSALFTVPEQFVPHSLHSYFILGAKGNIPITYKVHRLRDGKSFISRDVKAYQNDILVFTETISFKLKSLVRKGFPKQLETAIPTPNDVNFDDFISPRAALERASKLNNANGIIQSKRPSTKKLYIDGFDRDAMEYKFPPDFYQLSTIDPNSEDFGKKPYEVTNNMYVRIHKKIVDPRFHYVAFSYYSDAYVLIAVMKNYGRPMHSAFMGVSLDHVIYFHKEFNTNNWLLFRIKNPISLDSRVFTSSELYDDNALVASIYQEGLVVINDELLKRHARL